MQLPFNAFDLMNHAGQKGIITVIEDADVTEFNIKIDEGSDAIVGKLIVKKMASTISFLNQAVIIDEIMIDSDYQFDQLVVLLLGVAIDWYEQTVFQHICADENIASVYKNELFKLGFARIPRAHITQQQQYSIWQRGLNQHYIPRALFVIDYTNDFVATDGKLTTGSVGQAIEQNMVEEVEQAVRLDDIIFVFNDIHQENDMQHPETALFPLHNMEGTAGRFLYGQVRDAIDIAKAIQPERTFVENKTRYSAFRNTDANAILKTNKVDTVILTGVCTDICILHTAVDAYNEGYHIMVDESSVASFDSAGHAYAMQHFQNCLGADIVSVK